MKPAPTGTLVRVTGALAAIGATVLTLAVTIALPAGHAPGVDREVANRAGGGALAHGAARTGVHRRSGALASCPDGAAG